MKTLDAKGTVLPNETGKRTPRPEHRIEWSCRANLRAALVLCVAPDESTRIKNTDSGTRRHPAPHQPDLPAHRAQATAEAEATEPPTPVRPRPLDPLAPATAIPLVAAFRLVGIAIPIRGTPDNHLRKVANERDGYRLGAVLEVKRRLPMKSSKIFAAVTMGVLSVGLCTVAVGQDHATAQEVRKSNGSGQHPVEDG